MTQTTKAIDLEPARRLIDRHLTTEDPVTVQLEQLCLTVPPGVFCPTYTKTSAFLARHVRVAPGERVLDMFSGCGYQGLLVADRAASVVCVDCSAAATRATLANARANQLGQVTARSGDLFEPVRGQRFDVVIANPPLLPGEPTTALEAAIFDPDLVHTKRFVRQLGDHLTGPGRAYLISTDAHAGRGIFDPVGFAESSGLTAAPLAALTMPYETYTVFELARRNGD